MKSRLLNVALFLTSCLVALACIEVGLRLWGPEVSVEDSRSAFDRYDPVLGWDALANAEGYINSPEYSVLVKINSSGMRDSEIKEKRRNEFRVAVLGDSFTWGTGVAYGERFTEYLEVISPRINALNFGIRGYSPIQYLLKLDKALSAKPDFVVVVFCLGNDLSDNVSPSPYGRPKPYATLSADGETFEIKGYPLADMTGKHSGRRGASSGLRIVELAEHFLYRANNSGSKEGEGKLEQTVPYMPLGKLSAGERQHVLELYKVNDLIFAAMKRKIDSALGPHRFAVLLAPTKYETGQWHLPPGSDRNAVADRVAADLSRLDIPVIDGRPAIAESDFWIKNPHWRPSGHMKIARLLANFFAVNQPQIQPPGVQETGTHS